MTPGERSGLGRAAPTGLVPSGGWHRPLSRPGPRRCAGNVQRVTRFDTVSFLTDYGTTDEFVGVVQGRDPRHRAARRRSSTSPTASRPSTCAPARWRWRAASRTSRAASCWRSSIPASAPTAAASRSRSPAARASCSVRTTGCWRRPWRWRAAPSAPSSSTNPDYPAAAPGATFAGRDVFAPGRRPPLQRRRSGRARPRGRHRRCCCRASCRCRARRGRRDRRRGAVGRPLRQLPAQRRARTTCLRRGPATCSCASARKPSRPAVWCATPCAPRSFAALGPGQLGPRARLVRHAGDLPRPALGGRGARARRRRPGGARRARATTAAGRHRGAVRAPHRRPVASARCAPRPRSRSACCWRSILVAGIISLVRTLTPGQGSWRIAGRTGPSGGGTRWAGEPGAHHRRPRRRRVALDHRATGDDVRRAARPGRATCAAGSPGAASARRPRRDHVRQQPLLRHRVPRDVGLGAIAVPLNPRARRPSSSARSAWSTPVAVVVGPAARRRGRRSTAPRCATRSTRWSSPRATRRRRRCRSTRSRGGGPAAGRRRRARPSRRADVHQRHGRRAAGGDAQPRQPARQHRAGARRRDATSARRRRVRRAAAVPHLRPQRRARPHRCAVGATRRARAALRSVDRARDDPRPRRHGRARRAADVGGVRHFDDAPADAFATVRLATDRCGAGCPRTRCRAARSDRFGVDARRGLRPHRGVAGRHELGRAARSGSDRSARCSTASRCASSTTTATTCSSATPARSGCRARTCSRATSTTPRRPRGC